MGLLLQRILLQTLVEGILILPISKNTGTIPTLQI